ncbi:hypothetical protein SETIT_9G080100v2 [Setaria italica]|uniref:Uncharacterized protein n=2 Tax=Setaria TaxID=4554 RepID=A0A368SEF5_SETIT|nr:hypothetical protein SETIT_9G080100v2 [Setaria italica]TKV91197.1 hypothetical protein SEVIR_9G078500v2 [Setaria viridis]
MSYYTTRNRSVVVEISWLRKREGVEARGGNAIKSPRRTPAHRAALYPYLSA